MMIIIIIRIHHLALDLDMSADRCKSVCFALAVLPNQCCSDLCLDEKSDKLEEQVTHSNSMPLIGHFLHSVKLADCELVDDMLMR